MKKSANIALALLGTSILCACTPKGDVETGAYKNADQCLASGKFSVADCNSSFSAANEERRKNGPSYATKDECLRTNRDGCEETTTGHAAGSGRYIPSSSFYMVGRNAQTLNGTYYPAVQSQPLYHQAGRGLVNNAGEVVSARPGTFKLSHNSSALNRSSSVKSPASHRGGIGRIGGGRSASS